MKALALALLCAAGFAGQVSAAGLEAYRPTVKSASWQKNSQFVINIGLQNGGDEIQRLVDVDSGGVTDSARGGGYWRIGLGGNFALGQSDWSLEVLGGILYGNLTSNVNSDKGNFKRKIVEAIPYWNYGRSRVGLGLAAHFDPEWSQNLDGPGGIGHYTFDDAVGAVLQWDYRWDSSLSVGVRYTFIEYDLDTMDEDGVKVQGTGTLDGNAIGFHVNWSF